MKLIVFAAGFGVTLGVILLGLALTRPGKFGETSMYLSSLLYKGALKESEQRIKLRALMPREHKQEHKLKAHVGKILPQGWNPASGLSQPVLQRLEKKKNIPQKFNKRQHYFNESDACFLTSINQKL